jgi:ABC-type sulfate transport system permease subunit
MSQLSEVVRWLWKILYSISFVLNGLTFMVLWGLKNWFYEFILMLYLVILLTIPLKVLYFLNLGMNTNCTQLALVIVLWLKW